MLFLQTLGMTEGQRVKCRVCWLVPAGHKTVVIKEVRGETDDGLMGAIVLTEHDHTGTFAGVKVIETLQEGDVEALLPSVVGVDFWTDL